MASEFKVESVNDTGFTVLYEPENSVEPIADIVFVHGLQGHPRHTWTWDSPSIPPANSTPIECTPSKGSFSFFSKKKGKQSRSTQASKHAERYVLYWPYHLLYKDFPRARVLTWGYNSVVSNFFHGSANKNHMFAHSRDLLADLKGRRRTCPDRPLIFVAHSLGGIIVKQMLLLSGDSDREFDRNLCESTKAILFFGTPHRGSSFSDLGETMRRIVSAVGFDTAKQNIRALAIDSGMLEECHRRFQLLQADRKIEIYTFHETHGVTGISYLGGTDKVVEDTSAFFTGSETICSLDANHIEMCKFSSREDAGYQRTTDALVSQFDHLSKSKQSMIERKKVIEKEQIEQLDQLDLACSNSLRYTEMNFRHQEIRKAYRDSCIWLFRHESYIKWVNEDRGLLWIKGKPGSGKSTLMKRILESFEEQNSSKQIRLHFFFHRRGDPLQYTQIGMFRTILYQLLSQIPTARAKFRRLWEEKARYDGRQNVEWRLEELRDILSSSVLQIADGNTVRIFIDALDEAGEGPAQELLSYFHRLNDDIRASEACISICFSCRKYPFFAPNGSLEICVDDENHKDIKAYISAEFKRQFDQETSHPSVLDRLQADLGEKASGVFLWAHLMIPVIAKQYNDGEPLDSIQRKLDQVPSDLSHIYKHVLTRVVDVEKRPRTLRLMQWILLANWPLSVTELRHAMASDDSSVRPSQYSIKDSEGFIDNDEQMRKSIISLSGGLAEIKDYGRDATENHVQFIHESVNDFIREDRFTCLEIPFNGDYIGLGHYHLCMSCLNYLRVEEPQVPRKGPPYSAERFEFENRFPLIRYAAVYWRSHAEEAEFRGITLQGLLQRFEWPSQKLWRRWIEICTPFGMKWIPRSGATLLHVAASSNLLSTIRALLESKAKVDERDDEGATPLQYAASFEHEAIDNRASVLLLLEHGADIEAYSPYFGTALSAAAAVGNEPVVRLLVEKGADVNAKGGWLGSPLQAAALREEDVAVVRFLLDHGADVEGEEGVSRPLQCAAEYGTEAVVRLLVQRGAKVNASAGPDGTALQLAAGANSEVIVRILLGEGANVNAPAGPFGTALQLAVSANSEVIVRTLLGEGANVNATGGRDSKSTALQQAAHFGTEAILWLLIEAGADINLRSENRKTPFQLAKESDEDRKAKVQLLLEYKYGRRWAIKCGITLVGVARHIC